MIRIFDGNISGRVASGPHVEGENIRYTFSSKTEFEQLLQKIQHEFGEGDLDVSLYIEFD